MEQDYWLSTGTFWWSSFAFCKELLVNLTKFFQSKKAVPAVDLLMSISVFQHL